MIRTTLPALLLALPVAAAAPLPEAERDRLEVARAFGTWTDPDGFSRYEAVGGGAVRVGLPAHAQQAAEWVAGIPNAPAFVREIEGDFTAVVRVEVSTNLPPNPPPNPERLHYSGGGLVVADGGVNRAGVRVTARRNGDTPVGFWYTHWSPHGGRNGLAAFGDLPARGYVRVARTGQEVAVDCSWDGKTWTTCGPFRQDWGRTLRLGLVAENTLSARAEVTFDRSTLTRPTK